MSSEGHRTSEALVFDFDKKVNPYKAYRITEEIDPSLLSEINLKKTQEIVELYNKITSMDKLKDGFSWMMEFTLEPTYVLQLRRFRKFEDGSNIECSWKNEENVFKTGLSLGITNSHGLTLPFIANRYGWHFPYGYDDNFTRPVHNLNKKSADGFAVSDSYSHYLTTFYPNLKAVMGIDPQKMANHGNLENLSTVPLFLFQMKRELKKAFPDFDKKFNDANSVMKVFSNGREGLVKILENH